MTIEGNKIDRVDRIGIYVGPDYERAGSDKYLYPLFPKRMYNIVIRGNSIVSPTGTSTSFGAGGDGILTFISDRVLVEANTVSYSGSRIMSSPCPNWTGRCNTASVAIWTAVTNDSTIQLNEVHHYALPGNGPLNVDGQAFDTDFGTTNQTIQYNYSHENEGGFHLTYELCPDNPSGSLALNNITIRYNVSFHDRASSGGIFAFGGGDAACSGTDYSDRTHFPAGHDSLDIHNNLVITPPTGQTNVFATGHGTIVGTAYIYNNIFLTRGTLTYPRFTSAFFQDNIYYAPAYTSGRPCLEPGTDQYNCSQHAPYTPPPDAGTAPHGKQVGDPRLVSLSTSPPIGRINLDGLKLRSDSPALNAGYQSWVLGPYDFWLTPLTGTSTPNRGPYAGPGL